MATSQLSERDVFHYLRPEQINAIDKISETIDCHAGDLVYTRGDKARYLYALLDGQVELVLPGKGGIAVLIESLNRDAIFGTSASFAPRAWWFIGHRNPNDAVFGTNASFDPGTYTLTARCTADSKILKIDTIALRQLMEEDCRMGYAIQRHISDLYFKRFVETMNKLQAIVMNIPMVRE
jgi:CRP-like cAMP-binding protein